MDARTRDKYSTFTDEDWTRLGYLDPPSSEEYELGLSLLKLPIFHFRRLSKDKVGHMIWTQFIDAQNAKLCGKLDPVFRLASAMLQSPASLDHLYKIIYGPRRIPFKAIGGVNQPVFETERVETDETRRNMAKKALNRLAESLSFVVECPKKNVKDNCDAVVSHSTALHPYSINIADDSGTPRGIASVIRLNRIHLSKLSILHARDGDSTSQILSLQFSMAVSICHNVAHAVGQATNLTLLLSTIMKSTYRDLAKINKPQGSRERVKSNEPFVENESVAELGYSWENAVLGGAVQWTNQVDHPVFFSKWPSFLTNGDYPRRARFAPTTTQYVVSLHYLRNIHRQSFWDSIKASDDTALHIQKIVGIRVTNADADHKDHIFYTHPTPEGNELQSEDPDPFRGVADQTHDPSASRANETLAQRTSRANETLPNRASKPNETQAERTQRIAQARNSLRGAKLHIVNQINVEAVNARRRSQKIQQ